MKKAYRTVLSLVLVSLVLTAAAVIWMREELASTSAVQPEKQYYVGFARGGPGTNEPIYQISFETISHYTDAPSKLDSEQTVLYQAMQFALGHGGRYLLLDARLVPSTKEKQQEVFKLCQEGYDLAAIEYGKFNLKDPGVTGMVLHFLFLSDAISGDTVIVI